MRNSRCHKTFPVQKLGADRADFRPKSMAGHGHEPIGPKRLDVVIHKDEEAPTRPSGRRTCVILMNKSNTGFDQ